MSYKDKDGKSTAAEEHPPLPCRSCGDMTARSTLNTCGALCYPCYAAYLRDTPRNYRAGQPETPTVRDMKTRIRGRLSSPDLGRKAA